MPQPIGGRSPVAPATPSTPSTPGQPTQPTQPGPAGPTSWQPQARGTTTTPGAADAFQPAARTFSTSADGTPLFKQSDADWGTRRLGNSATISEAGCAMTSSAMAMSKISGEVITPAALDAWLDKNHGYAGDSLDWSRLGAFKKLLPELKNYSLANINASLDAGRPVVLGVDYKAGSGGGSNGTDHWVCVTSRTVAPDGSVSYQANDPGTGNTITLRPDRAGRLIGDGVGALGTYRSSGQLRVFTDV
jgi:hypothetical protein